MASASSSSASPSKNAGVRARARFPKARPNVLGAERRSGTSAPLTPKPAAATDDEIKAPPPPPVRRMARLVFSPSHAEPEPVHQLSASLNIIADAPLHSKESHSPENFSVLVQPHSPVAIVQKTVSEPEKISTPPSVISAVMTKTTTTITSTTATKHQERKLSTTTTSSATKHRERKLSSRGVNESKEMEQAKKQRNKKVLEPPERSKMTMFDLIYWNPTSNPMTYEEDECRIPLSNKEGNVPDQLANSERLAEEAVDDPENIDVSLNCTEENVLQEEHDCTPVPQVKIGPDGRIVLDEQSLVIEATTAKKDLSSSPAVYERSSNVTYSSFRDKKSIKTWSNKETAKFYMALSSVGTDFSMIGNLLPKRTRNELKLKFKKEDKLNKALVDKAIRDHHQYDLSLFEESDEEVENQLTEAIAEARKAQRKRSTSRKKKKNVENGEACGVAKKKLGKRKKRPSKQCKHWQEESDSDIGANHGLSDKTDNATDQPIITNMVPGSEDAANIVDRPIIPDSQANDEEQFNAEEGELGENFDDEECSDSEKILEGVLKQTRSGRQPKKKSPFTIEIAEPKRQRRKKLKEADLNKNKLIQRNIVLPTAEDAVAHTLANADSINNVSPSRLILVAESANADGSQLLQFYMVSPPVHSLERKSLQSPLSEHDYSKPMQSCETVVDIPTYQLETGEVVEIISVDSSLPTAATEHTTVVENTIVATHSCNASEIVV